jgi:hypothetical protein
MNEEYRPVRTITLPTEELLEAVSPLPDGIRAGVWDVVGEPRSTPSSCPTAPAATGKRRWTASRT